MLLFLSFAADDSEAAEAIALSLSQRDFRICSRRGTRVDDPEVAGSPEFKISKADAFVAVMSPSYLASASCRRDRVLALHKETPGTADGPQRFIHVLVVRETPYLDTGELRSRHWVEMTDARGSDTALNELQERLVLAIQGANAEWAGSRHELLTFRNRESELDEVLDNLTSQVGPHFWRLIAPPQLGKSWFLDRIDMDLEDRAPGRWTVKLVDLREKPTEVRKNVGAILGMLFGASAPVTTDVDSLMQLAGRINRAGKFHLCMLDSAELLDKRTTDDLRNSLSQIYKAVSRAPRTGVRLAVIVAGRGRGWAGVTPGPRMRKCMLSEFKVNVVADALLNMSERMEYEFTSDQLRLYAADVHRLCEGLPALLYRYLTWIHDQEWIDLDRLLEERQFDRITQPYIRRELLSERSLFGPGGAPTAEQSRCLTEALQLLAPYRLYTRGHVSQHMGPNGILHTFLEPSGWTEEKLLDTVSDTDLLYRPQNQPWEEIYAPIRRLLCRYWYPSSASLAQAHVTARQYARSWCSNVTGWEQAVALVECLWHQSQILRLNRAEDPEGELLRLAREISTSLPQSEVRRFAVDAISDDEELLEAAEYLGVSIEDLINAVGRSQP